MTSITTIQPKALTEKAYEAFFRESYTALCRYANSFTKDPERAEELVQKTFVHLWEKKDTIVLNESLLAYFFKAIRNGFLNEERHKKIVHLHVEEMSVTNRSSQIEDFEVQEKVQEALETLPTQCKKVFELNRFGGKKYQEVANELGVSVKTVENQMGKALKLMRVALKEFLSITILIANYFIS